MSRAGPAPLSRALCPSPGRPNAQRMGQGGGVPTLLLAPPPRPRPGPQTWLQGPPHCALLPTSWKTGPWTLCSASCGGGFQSRSIYCVSSDGAGAQEAAEDAECEGLPEKPPGRRSCNLQRCAGWSVEPWSEVRPGPAGTGWPSGAGWQAWAAASNTKRLVILRGSGSWETRDLPGGPGSCGQGWV